MPLSEGGLPLSGGGLPLSGGGLPLSGGGLSQVPLSAGGGGLPLSGGGLSPDPLFGIGVALPLFGVAVNLLGLPGSGTKGLFLGGGHGSPLGFFPGPCGPGLPTPLLTASGLLSTNLPAGGCLFSSCSGGQGVFCKEF